MRFLLIFFIAFPLLEMLLLFEVAAAIGGLATLALVVLTAVAGVAILRRQGWRTLARANERLRVGQLPALEMLEGLCLAVGGALLIVPGLITDAVGALLLLPPTRRRIIKALLKSGRLQVHPGFDVPPPGFRRGPGGADVFEGEFTREYPPGQRLDDRHRD